MAICKECQKEIPTRLFTEKGWITVSNSRKYCFECSPRGGYHERMTHDDGGTCSSCGKSFLKRGKATVGICPSCRVTAWRKRMKLKAITYKGGACVKCGFNKYTGSLEFHHLDPSQKDFGFSGITVSWTRMQKELDKCILVCANCHAAIHSRELL